MSPMASQITSLGIVYSTVYSGSDQRKHQSSASLAFVQRIHRGPVNSPQKWPVTRKMFSFDDVIMGTAKILFHFGVIFFLVIQHKYTRDSSLRPSDAMWHYKLEKTINDGPFLGMSRAQHQVCRGTNPNVLSPISSGTNIQWKSNPNKIIFTQKCFVKCRLQNGYLFVQFSMCQQHDCPPTKSPHAASATPKWAILLSPGNKCLVTSPYITLYWTGDELWGHTTMWGSLFKARTRSPFLLPNLLQISADTSGEWPQW